MTRVAPRPVLLYDTSCRLCRWTARLVAALDRSGELGLVGLEDDAADALLERVIKEERLSSARLVLPEGQLLSGGEVVLETLALLPATRPLARVVEALHAEAAVARLYDLVARNRGRLGRLVPDGPAPRRLL